MAEEAERFDRKVDKLERLLADLYDSENYVDLDSGLKERIQELLKK